MLLYFPFAHPRVQSEEESEKYTIVDSSSTRLNKVLVSIWGQEGALCTHYSIY